MPFRTRKSFQPLWGKNLKATVPAIGLIIFLIFKGRNASEIKCNGNCNKNDYRESNSSPQVNCRDSGSCNKV